jgi:ribosomal-protein-alanine N-acetyltransferase
MIIFNMQLEIETSRLTLRPFRLTDSERVAKLAGDRLIYEMTENIPYPYEIHMAEYWIQTHKAQYLEKKALIYAITFKDSDEIIGCVSFPKLENGVGVLGYWLGVQYWGNGIAFEASKALIEHCKNHHNLSVLEVEHLTGNNRSKSVILKLKIPYIQTKKLISNADFSRQCDTA